MKRFFLFIVVLFFGGIFFASAQDLIFLRDGNVIEAQIDEISPTEIRYRRFDHQTGPVVVISAAEVMTIRYQNGTVEIIRAAAPGREPRVWADDLAMDPAKWNFGVFTNPLGFEFYGGDGGGFDYFSLLLGLELTKGLFNTQLYFLFPIGGEGRGFNIGLALNYFHHTRTGGFYIGGFLEFAYEYYEWFQEYWSGYDLEEIWYEESYEYGTLALNTGYKFVFSSGLYIRTGVNVGVEWWMGEWDLYSSFKFKPHVTLGYYF